MPKTNHPVQAPHLLRIFVGESDKSRGKPLYEAIVIEAKRRELAGATVLRGIMGFGANSVIHRAHLLEISSDLPMVVEIVDDSEKIHAFITFVRHLFEECNSGGLITLEKIEVVTYRHDNR